MRAVTPSNGRLDARLLSPIGAGFQLRWNAAASYLRMHGAGLPAGVTTAYRTRKQQQDLREDWLAGRGAFAWPAGMSQHGEGLALDLPEPARSWAVKRGRAYGWRRTDPKEPWHFEYFPDEDLHIPPPPPPPPPPSTRRKAPTMFVYQKSRTTYRLVTGDRVVGITETLFQNLIAAGIPNVSVPAADALTFDSQLQSEG